MKKSKRLCFCLLPALNSLLLVDLSIQADSKTMDLLFCIEFFTNLGQTLVMRSFADLRLCREMGIFLSQSMCFGYKSFSLSFGMIDLSSIYIYFSALKTSVLFS